MCGISGILKFNRDDHVDPGQITRMTNVMAHRGPNGSGRFMDGNVGLGHRRLSIIDLAGGDQPIFNEDHTVAVVFNGEIYNYADLTGDLVARGHTFRTRSDTETIVHAYEEYGDGCVEHFRGMFTFAIWDKTKRRLLLARDRLGVKPLYYYEGPDFLAFASEIKALFEIPGVPREVDPESLNCYLSLRYVPGPRTMFRNIFKLQPGHTLVHDRNGVTVRKFWDIAFSSRERSPKEVLEEFEHLLAESVRLRMIAEVPLGVFLSGGLDSTAILTMMSRHGERRGIKTFSVGYEEVTGQESGLNEFDYARLAAKELGAEHHEYRMTPQDISDFLPDLVWHLDEPLGDPSCVPLYYISRVAREHITVVLSGEGADEILAGYSIYQRMLQFESAHRALGGMTSALTPLLRHVLPGRNARTALDWINSPLEQRYRGVSRAFLPELKRELLPASSDRRRDGILDGVFASHFQEVSQASALNQMLYVDTRVWLPDDLLLKADKMTMANSLELRVPFLDHKLVEFAAQLPAREKLAGKTTKALLRRAMAEAVPDSILKRSKKGFPVPTRQWLKTELADTVRDALLSPNSSVRNHMDGDAVRRIVRQNEQGQPMDQEVWTLLVFEYWHRMFIDRSMGRQEVA